MTIIFTGGNYYRRSSNPRTVAQARAGQIEMARWIKSRQKFSSNYYVYKIDKYVELTEEQAQEQGLAMGVQS